MARGCHTEADGVWREISVTGVSPTGTLLTGETRAAENPAARPSPGPNGSGYARTRVWYSSA